MQCRCKEHSWYWRDGASYTDWQSNSIYFLILLEKQEEQSESKAAFTCTTLCTVKLCWLWAVLIDDGQESLTVLNSVRSASRDWDTGSCWIAFDSLAILTEYTTPTPGCCAACTAVVNLVVGWWAQSAYIPTCRCNTNGNSEKTCTMRIWWNYWYCLWWRYDSHPSPKWFLWKTNGQLQFQDECVNKVYAVRLKRLTEPSDSTR